MELQQFLSRPSGPDARHEGIGVDNKQLPNGVACICLVGRWYSKPQESLFTTVKHLDPHAPVRCDGFAEPPLVKYWFSENVCELYGAGCAPSCKTRYRLSRKVAVIESFHGCGFPNEVPAIDERFVTLVECDVFKQL